MKRLFTTAVVLGAAGTLFAVPPASPTPRADSKADAAHFLFEAVRDGLAEDGVLPALARELAKRDGDFIPKCVICGHTRKALFAYGDLKDAPAAKEGRGLSEEFVKRLQSGTDATRRAALRELVQRYVERAYVRHDVTAEARAAIQKELEEMRKAAMGGLRAGQKFCPSCDGACRLTPKL